jgi:hypothetical protein
MVLTRADDLHWVEALDVCPAPSALPLEEIPLKTRRFALALIALVTLLFSACGAPIADGGAYVYLQPSFVSTGANDRVEVIRDMVLEVTSPAGERTSFSWDQELRLETDPETGALTYEYVADAVPILVGPRDAASPLSLFDAPNGWFFAPGSYTFVLAADRVVVGQPLSAQFSLTLTPENVAFLDQPGPDRFLTFPID